MATSTKNTYERKHDDVIMAALEESPDNRNEAFRIAEKRLKEKYNMVATPNQISSRFYTYIKPNYLDNKEEEHKNHIITSAGSAIASTHGKHYNIVRDLALRLDAESRSDLVKELFDSLAD